MDKLHLINAITTLETLREQCCTELDASTLAEFDEVIEQLRQCLNSSEAVIFFYAELTYRIMSLMVMVMELSPNLSEWILSAFKYFKHIIK